MSNMEMNSSLNLITKIIKNQNRDLLYELAKFKQLNEEETIKFIEDFLKPNYYCPTIVKYYKKETKN